MSCYSPLCAIWSGTNEYTGKAKVKIIPRRSLSPEAVKGKDFFEVPCGHCIGCRLDYSREWANRLMMELKYHDSAYFVTLTYDDIHVPKSYYTDKETGEKKVALTIRKRDFQLFMKRLRKAFPNDNLRYYACFEYGSTTFRPHIHAIIFGLHLDDLRVYRRSKEGFIYYNSDRLNDIWSVPKSYPVDRLGFAVVADVTWETCAYTARYVTKKLSGYESDFYASHGLEPPCSLMSRQPGIGNQYYLDNIQGMYNDRFVIRQGNEVKPPRYFSRLFEVDYPEESAIIKEQKYIFSKHKEVLELSKTDLLKTDYLISKEHAKENQIKALRRNQL